jgi:hypothetical protein
MSTAMPANPQYVNSVTSGTDTSLVESLTAAGLQYFVPTESPVVTSNSHPVVSRADGALYDITSGAYVAIQNTNFGTTVCPKAGQ